MRVVVDANVVISGIFWGGPPQIILKRWLEGKLTLVMSALILAEYQDVLRRMTGNQGGDVFAKWNHFLTELSEFVEPQQVSAICRDSGDQKYLEAATGGRVQALISGDKDLVVLKVIERIPILTPRAFLLGHKIQ